MECYLVSQTSAFFFFILEHYARKGQDQLVKLPASPDYV